MLGNGMELPFPLKIKTSALHNCQAGLDFDPDDELVTSLTTFFGIILLVFCVFWEQIEAILESM